MVCLTVALVNSSIATQNITSPMTTNIQQNIQAQVVAQVAAQQVAAQQVAAQVAAHQQVQAQVAAQVQQVQQVAAQVQQAQVAAQATIAASVPNIGTLSQSTTSFNNSRGPCSISTSYPTHTNSICTISATGQVQAQPSQQPSALNGKPMILSIQSGAVNPNQSQSIPINQSQPIPITVACSLPVSLGVMGLPPSSLSVSHAPMGPSPQNSMTMGPLMTAQHAMASVASMVGKSITQQQQMNSQIQSTASQPLVGPSVVRTAGPQGPPTQIPPPTIPPPPLRGPAPAPASGGRVGPSSSGTNSNQHLISYPIISRSK
jgi:hypothetical protein